jgi:ADP-heptose:LPS heptosyltransferase
MRLSAMGDVAMTVPVLRAFVKQYPQVKITCYIFSNLLKGILLFFA